MLPAGDPPSTARPVRSKAPHPLHAEFPAIAERSTPVVCAIRGKRPGRSTLTLTRWPGRDRCVSGSDSDARSLRCRNLSRSPAALPWVGTLLGFAARIQGMSRRGFVVRGEDAMWGPPVPRGTEGHACLSRLAEKEKRVLSQAGPQASVTDHETQGSCMARRTGHAPIPYRPERGDHEDRPGRSP